MIPAIGQYQDFFAACTAFAQDIALLADRSWKEIRKQQLEVARQCQDLGERQMQTLSKGDWATLTTEPSRMLMDFSQDSFERAENIYRLYIDIAEGMRDSLRRFEPLWGEQAWQAMTEATRTTHTIVANDTKSRSKAA